MARAFLRRLGGRRGNFGRVVLLDKKIRVLDDRFLEQRRLDYQFVRRRLRFPEDRLYYHKLLQRYQINIVLDLSDMDTLPTLAATDAAGVSYVCTSLNDEKYAVTEMVDLTHPSRERKRNAPHILGSGMNPGAVNIWVHHAVRRFGIPKEIIHFEYDTSTPTDGWRPVVTWSRKEFLTECVWEPTGIVVEGKPVVFETNSLANRQEMRSIMRPVVSLRSYPRGFLILHEENLTLGRRFGVSSKFLYAIHPKTMAYMVRRWRKRGEFLLNDIGVGDNTSLPLTGEDTIGVCLEYPRQRIYYVHSLANRSVVGTNATCAQVAVGVYAALFTLLRNKLAPRVYFPGDLYDTLYPRVLFGNMRVEQYVFAKRKRSLILRHHEPEVRPRFLRGEEQLII